MESVLKSPGTVTWLTVEMDDSIHSFIHSYSDIQLKEKKKNTMYEQFVSWLRPMLCGREPRIAFLGTVGGRRKQTEMQAAMLQQNWGVVLKLYLPAISAFRISSLVLHHIHPCHLISGDFQRTEPSLQWRLCSMRWNLTNQSHRHKCLGNAPDSLVSKLNNCKCLALSTDWADWAERPT